MFRSAFFLALVGASSASLFGLLGGGPALGAPPVGGGGQCSCSCAPPPPPVQATPVIFATLAQAPPVSYAPPAPSYAIAPPAAPPVASYPVAPNSYAVAGK